MAASMMKKWNSPIYAFFHLPPEVKREGDRTKHVFKCAARTCVSSGGPFVTRYLDTKDARSTGNLRRHAKTCWGVEAITMASQARDKDEARKKVVKKIMISGNLPSMLEFETKGKKTYSHMPLTRLQTRWEHDYNLTGKILNILQGSVGPLGCKK